MYFFTNLDLPRDERSTYIPSSWATDSVLSWEARGVVATLASLLIAPGHHVTHWEIADHQHPDDLPISSFLLPLIASGYLIPGMAGTIERYELVHPDHLPPLPTQPVL